MYFCPSVPLFLSACADTGEWGGAERELRSQQGVLGRSGGGAEEGAGAVRNHAATYTQCVSWTLHGHSMDTSFSHSAPGKNPFRAAIAPGQRSDQLRKCTGLMLSTL